MVELSDFMAYLDSVTSGLDSHVYKYHKQTEYIKKGCCTRSNILYKLMKEKHIIFYDNNKARQLCNIFIDSPPELFEVNIDDLLSISKVGQKRTF